MRFGLKIFWGLGFIVLILFSFFKIDSIEGSKILAPRSEINIYRLYLKNRNRTRAFNAEKIFGSEELFKSSILRNSFYLKKILESELKRPEDNNHSLENLSILFKLQNLLLLKNQNIYENNIENIKAVHSFSSNTTKFYVVYLTPLKTPLIDLPKSLGLDISEPSINSNSNKVYVLSGHRFNPYNLDRKNNHKQDLRVVSGQYAGFYNNPRFGGPILMGHPDATLILEKSWKHGHWKKIPHIIETKKRKNHYLVFIDNSAQMKLSDPKELGNCARKQALSEVILRSQGSGIKLVFTGELSAKIRFDLSPSHSSEQNLMGYIEKNACLSKDEFMVNENWNFIEDWIKEKRRRNSKIIIVLDQTHQFEELNSLSKKYFGKKIFVPRELLSRVMINLLG